MNAKLRLPGSEFLDKVQVGIASATVVEVGDLISYESGLAVKLDAQAEDATFIGVSASKSAVGEIDPIVVLTNGIYELTVVSAAYTIGQALHYNTSGYLEAATANSLGWSWQDTAGGNVTTLKVKFDVVALNKLFSISA